MRTVSVPPREGPLGEAGLSATVDGDTPDSAATDVVGATPSSAESPPPEHAPRTRAAAASAAANRNGLRRTAREEGPRNSTIRPWWHPPPAPPHHAAADHAWPASRGRTRTGARTRCRWIHGVRPPRAHRPMAPVASARARPPGDRCRHRRRLNGPRHRRGPRGGDLSAMVCRICGVDERSIDSPVELG